MNINKKPAAKNPLKDVLGGFLGGKKKKKD